MQQEKIQAACEGLRGAGIAFAPNEPLKPYTSFQIGGPAAIFVRPQTAAEVAKALAVAREAGVPYTLLGKGSNVLFRDEGYKGMVVHIDQGLDGIELGPEGTVTVGAGAKLMDVCVAARDAGLKGLEFAFGIPGSIGGAVYMNAGAYGGEMCHVLESVTYLDEAGTVRQMALAEACLGYRTSVFQGKPWCILSATLRLAHGDKVEISEAMRDYMQRRADKQPLEYPSAGSAFKRPPGAFAGALIDECGLRGHQVGGAAISGKHCGFIVNLGGATCADVLALADEVVAIVKRDTGYTLEKEIRVIEAGDGA